MCIVSCVFLSLCGKFFDFNLSTHVPFLDFDDVYMDFLVVDCDISVVDFVFQAVDFVSAENSIFSNVAKTRVESGFSRFPMPIMIL